MRCAILAGAGAGRLEGAEANRAATNLGLLKAER